MERDNLVVVRMSTEEKDALRKQAAVRGMSVGAYIRYKMLYEGKGEDNA